MMEDWYVTICVFLVVCGVTTCSVSDDIKKSSKYELDTVKAQLVECKDENRLLTGLRINNLRTEVE
jgi:hypothetical protein